MSFSSLNELHWWHALIVVGVGAVYPVFRAVAVVVVARCVKEDIAKLAIPLVLRPLRPPAFRPRNEGGEVQGKGPGGENGPRAQ